MAFADRLIAWHAWHGRRGLPWQGTRDPYLVWLSEVMLQQTRVTAVIPYYKRFLQRFPTVETLAEAKEDDVLRLWSGLGYYARGRNLHAAAKWIAARGFPTTAEGIAGLPGVGRSTAAAIAAFAFGERAAILDGNVKRVLTRCFHTEDKRSLWALAESLLPKKGIETYTQALMDLGATVCLRRKPRCNACPVRRNCIARKKGLVDQLPPPRPRKALALKNVRWLILVRKEKVLLERRPGAGIWGGLLAFPDLPEADAAGYALRALGCEVASVQELEPLEHGFTHFRLRATPLLCRVQRIVPRAASPGILWIPLATAADAAVPVPVRKVLRKIGL